MLELVEAAAPRVAALGGWPDFVALESLSARVPTSERRATGFDAGIACALDLIPRERQRLAATLHAAYTPEAVEQARREAGDLDSDSETCWWLAACHVCEEGQLAPADFDAQLAAFAQLAADPQARLAAAESEYARMMTLFQVRNGIAFGVEDGAMQGAYLAGHDLAGMYAAEHHLWFLGTFRESLGLDDFAWSTELDDELRPRSGPVWGSRQFCKAASEDEYMRAAAIARRTLSPIE
jgi:hypothetical protein